MKAVHVSLVLALCLALPVAAADEAAKKNTTEGPVTQARIEEAAAGVASDQAQQGEEPQTDSPQAGEPEPPTVEEVSGRVDSMGEAFTEMKNTVDIINRMRFSGYIQAQYVDDQRSASSLSSATSTNNRDQFSIRRGRIKFTYQASPNSRFVFQPDITTSGTSIKDAWVEYSEPWTTWRNTLMAGQFNWPFGFDIGYSSSSREVPERALVTRTLFPGERDRGVQLTGRGFGERFIYQVAVVNGTGTSQSFDFNKRKDLVGRVGMNFGPLDVAVSGYNGTDLAATAQRPAGVEFEKDRYGVDFQYVTPLPGLGIRGEYVQGKERGSDVDGWYAYAIQNLGTRHQLVVRADEYDPNTDVSDRGCVSGTSFSRCSTFTWTAAYIFHWDANSKVMFAYEMPEREVNDPDDDALTIRFQYAF